MKNQIKPWSTFLLLVVATTALACQNKKPDPQAAVEEVAEQPLEEAKAEEAEVPDTGRYTVLPFGKLNAEQRTLFVKVAKSELCPCEGAVTSLDECLQDKEEACDIAIAAAGSAMQAIYDGKGETEALNVASQTATELKKTYTFTLEGRPTIGDENAKVVIVEFADFQCPFCRHASKALEETAKAYQGKGVSYTFKHFPLDMHPLGKPAALAAIAAQKQGKFWEMHDLIFDHQASLQEDSFDNFARELGLNLKKFTEDKNSEESLALLEEDRKEGIAANLRGTPTVYVNNKLYMASPTDSDTLHQKIDELLSK